MIPGLSAIAAGGAVVTAPFALITGCLFTLGIRASGAEPRKIYFWEAAGAVAGGAFIAAVLGKIGYFHIGFIILGLNSLSALKLKPGCLAIIPLTAAALIWAAPGLEKSTLKFKWKGCELLKHTESVYGDIAVTRIDGQYAVFRNGLLTQSFPDHASAEETVHFPLLSHQKPQRVFLLGSGFNGAVNEALKHPSVAKIDYAEIDRKLITTVAESFPPEAGEFLRRPQVEIIAGDGRAWIKNARSIYDLIIIDLPEPVTAQMNRYYTVEFFQEARRALNPEGILAFKLSSSEDFIDPELADFLAGIRRTLDEVFPHIALLPGAECHFLAGNQPFAADAGSLMRRLSERGVKTDFISPYYLPYRLDPDRVEYLENALSKVDSKWINRDFHPLAYIKALTRWDRQFHPGGGALYEGLWKVGHSLIPVILLCGFMLTLLTLKGSLRQRGIKIAVAAGGFAQMGMQVTLIFGFQSIFGYMYYQQALLIAAFMAGAAVGSGMAGNRWARLPNFIALQAMAAAFPLLIFSALWLARIAGNPAVNLLTAAAIFCGILGGAQYSLAAGLLKRAPSPASGGRLYALDLFGAAAGALLAGIVMIPMLGFAYTAIALAALGAAPLILILAGGNKR